MAVNTIQFAWRIRTDSTAAQGGTPVWAAAQNVTAYPGLTTPFRFRFSIENTGSTASGSHAWELYVSRNGAAPIAVTTTGTYVKAIDATGGASANNSAISTALLTGASGTFLNGLYNDTGATSALSLTATHYTEFEFGLEFTASCADGDTYQFFVYTNSLALTGTVQAPTITIPGATITAPVFICNANPASYINSGVASPPTTTDTPSGSLVYLWLASVNTNDTFSAITDSAGNNYLSSVVQAPSNAGCTASAIAWFHLTADLPQGSTFTVSTTSGGQWVAQMYAVTGVSTIDKTTTQTQTTAGTSASESTGTLSTANEIIFTFIQNQSSGFGTYTESSGGFNQLFNDAYGDGSYQIVSSTSSVTYAPSWTSSSAWNAVVVSFKAAITTVSLLTAALARGSGNLSLGGNASLLVTSKAKATGGASTAGVTGLLAIGKSRIAGQNQPSGIVGILSRGEAQSKGGSQPSGRVSIGIKTAAQATAKLSGSFALALKAAAKAQASGRNAPSGVVGLAARAVSDAFARTAISVVASLVSIAASSGATAKGTAGISAKAAIQAGSKAVANGRNVVTAVAGMIAAGRAEALGRLGSGGFALALRAASTARVSGRNQPSGIVGLAARAMSDAFGRASISAVANLVSIYGAGRAMATGAASLSGRAAIKASAAAMARGASGIGGATALGAKSIAAARARMAISATAALGAGSNAIAAGRSGLKGAVRIAASAHASATSQSSIYAFANLAALSTISKAVATSKTLISAVSTLTGRYARMITGSGGTINVTGSGGGTINVTGKLGPNP